MHALLLLCVTTLCAAHNVLILHPFTYRSHALTLRAVAAALVDRGHHVTTVRFEEEPAVRLKAIPHNHSEILLYLNNSDGSLPYVTPGEDGRFSMPMDVLWQSGLSTSLVKQVTFDPWRVVAAQCDAVLGDARLVRRLRQADFHVAVVDLLMNECGLALAAHLGVPAVAYWSQSPAGVEIELTTAATPPSHVPMLLSELADHMTFLERALNLSLKLFHRLLISFHVWRTDAFIQRNAPDVASAYQLIGNLSGALINTHSVIDYPRLLPSTFIEVGGIQIVEKNSPLPENIDAWMSSSASGVILFTMGCTVDTMPNSTLSAFLTAFRLLPQYRVIMARIHVPEDLRPANVMTVPFAPQQDILADPRTRLFVTHCGMHGVLESIYHSVPMVCMPVFNDQGDVRARVERKGIGLGLRKDAGPDQILAAIHEVVSNQSFSERVSSLSDLMRTRRSSPMSDAVWLLELVARTRGADHLKLASRHLSLAQYYCVDVVAFSIAVAVALHLALRAIIKRSKRMKD